MNINPEAVSTHLSRNFSLQNHPYCSQVPLNLSICFTWSEIMANALPRCSKSKSKFILSQQRKDLIHQKRVFYFILSLFFFLNGSLPLVLQDRNRLWKKTSENCVFSCWSLFPSRFPLGHPQILIVDSCRQHHFRNQSDIKILQVFCFRLPSTSMVRLCKRDVFVILLEKAAFHSGI